MRVRVLLLALIMLMLGDFLFRGVLPAFRFNRNDFSDPFAGAWLLRHGQDSYDSASATRVSAGVAHASAYVVPVYPPTAYLLLSPLTLLPWRWANLIWALLGMTGVGLSIYALLRITEVSAKDNRYWILAAFVCSFWPFHSAVHVGNVAALVSGLCLLAISLGERRRDLAAGLLLALAGCLKPQLALCVLLFYVFRRRRPLVITASVSGLLLAAVAIASIPASPAAWIPQYLHNLHYWFKAGGLNDFSVANPLRFELVNAQVLLAGWFHSSHAPNPLAWTLAGLGFGVWGVTILRSNDVNDSLALSSLLGLSLLPVYHRSYDTAILVLAFAWALKSVKGDLKVPARCSMGLMVVLGLPSVATFVDPRKAWWSAALSLVPACAVLLLNFALLYSAVRSARAITGVTGDREIEQQLSLATPPIAAA